MAVGSTTKKAMVVNLHPTVFLWVLICFDLPTNMRQLRPANRGAVYNYWGVCSTHKGVRDGSSNHKLMRPRKHGMEIYPTQMGTVENLMIETSRSPHS